MIEYLSNRAQAFLQMVNCRPFSSLFQRPVAVILVGIACLLPLSLANAQDAVERKSLVDLTGPDVNTNAISEQTGSSKDSAPLDLAQPMPPMPGQETGEIDGNENVITLSAPVKPLRIGLIAERGATYMQTRIEPFRSYMEDSLSRPVEIVAFRSMQMLMAAHTGGQIDYASYPASIFAMAHASCGCIEPLVAPVSNAAPDGIYMLLLVRADSGITSLAELTGRSMALTSRAGALPFHMALNELRNSGLNPDRDLASVFSADGPGEALAMLEAGETDSALVWSTTQYNQTLLTNAGAVSAYIEKEKSKGKKNAEGLNVISIWRSPPIPSGPHAVHRDVSKQERSEISRALIEMAKRDPAAYDAIERTYGGGFRRVSLDDYSPLISIATAR